MSHLSSITSLSGSSQGNKIKKIEHFRVPPRWLFVRIETEDGVVGWGESTLEGHIEATEGAVDAMARYFTGWPAQNIEDIWQVGHRAGFYRNGPVLMSALAGIDVALWDIKGKQLGVPVWDLLGGKVREHIKVYGWIGGDSAKDVASAAVARKQQGFEAVKMNATENVGWLDSPSKLEAAVDNLKSIKELQLDVGLDFHGRLHIPMARQLAALLAPHQPLFIEEPVLPSPAHITNLQSIRQAAPIPIALGERLFTRSDFLPYLQAGAVDMVQPDIAHAGGISEMRRIATLAEAFDVGFAPHCPVGPIALAGSLAVDAVSSNFIIQEMSLGMHYNVGGDLLTYVKNPASFDVVKGHITVPTAPGLGVEIDEEAVRKVSKELRDRKEVWITPAWRADNGELREW